MDWTTRAQFDPVLEKEFAVLSAGFRTASQEAIAEHGEASLFFSDPAYAIDAYAKDNH